MTEQELYKMRGQIQEADKIKRNIDQLKQVQLRYSNKQYNIKDLVVDLAGILSDNELKESLMLHLTRTIKDLEAQFKEFKVTP